MLSFFTLIFIIIAQAILIIFLHIENKSLQEDADELTFRLFKMGWEEQERDKYRAALEEIAAFNSKIVPFEDTVSWWSSNAWRLSRIAENALGIF